MTTDPSVRLAWGLRGARDAAARGDVVVVVDVLSFSSAVAVAVERGAEVFPCAAGDDPHAIARRVRAEVAVRRADVPAKGAFSLSPGKFRRAPAGTRVVLPSPNGATCAVAAAAGGARHVLSGCLLNAGAVAEAAERTAREEAAAITVVACGERWEDGSLRVALEDHLGAGAIVARLGFPRLPEASAAAGAFAAVAGRLEELLLDCESGVELRARGFAEDVRGSARLDECRSAPRLRDGAFLAG